MLYIQISVLIDTDSINLEAEMVIKASKHLIYSMFSIVEALNFKCPLLTLEASSFQIFKKALNGKDSEICLLHPVDSY